MRVVCALLAGVAVCLAAAAAAQADPQSYGSNGVFGVGKPVDGWTTRFIPPGRYRVDQAPSMYPYLSPPGFWLRCNDFPCTPTDPDHVIATGEAVRDVATYVDIPPTDTAVSLHNVTLTPA